MTRTAAVGDPNSVSLTHLGGAVFDGLCQCGALEVQQDTVSLAFGLDLALLKADDAFQHNAVLGSALRTELGSTGAPFELGERLAKRCIQHAFSLSRLVTLVAKLVDHHFHSLSVDYGRPALISARVNLLRSSISLLYGPKSLGQRLTSWIFINSVNAVDIAPK